jgi:ADP-ribose pyrophosphatase YjhB (NUDIX family)
MVVQVLWKGRKNLENIRWKHDASKKFSFSQEFMERKNQLWAEMTAEFPQIYDGTIVVLEKYQVEEAQIIFYNRSIKFSELVMLERNNLPMPESLGPLGFQAVVLNQPKSHFLMGKRSEKSEYKPGYLTIPGGLFEMDDLKGSVKDACLRELNEEIDLQFDESEMHLIAILKDYGLGINLLIESQILEERSTAHYVTGNEEWENKLQWMTFANAQNLDEKLILEGLSFIKNHRK